MPLVNTICVFCNTDTKDTQDVFQLYNIRVCKACAPDFVDFLLDQYRPQLMVRQKQQKCKHLFGFCKSCRSTLFCLLPDEQPNEEKLEMHATIDHSVECFDCHLQVSGNELTRFHPGGEECPTP